MHSFIHVGMHIYMFMYIDTWRACAIHTFLSEKMYAIYVHNFRQLFSDLYMSSDDSGNSEILQML